jgi:hypothetical protein
MQASVGRVLETTFDLESLRCLHEFPERRFERNEAEVKQGSTTHTLIKMTAGSDALGFREECVLLQLKCDLLETPEIAKILCNVYKGSCIAKYPLKQFFTIDLPC